MFACLALIYRHQDAKRRRHRRLNLPISRLRGRSLVHSLVSTAVVVSVVPFLSARRLEQQVLKLADRHRCPYPWYQNVRLGCARSGSACVSRTIGASIISTVVSDSGVQVVRFLKTRQVLGPDADHQHYKKGSGAKSDPR